MPLEWEEVNDSLDPRAFTIRTALERMERLGTDPVRPVMETKLDLVGVLERLAEVMA
jgi:DNA primase